MTEHDETREVSRRTFLFELAAMGVGAASVMSVVRAPARTTGGARAASIDMVGLQMYTVRDQLQADFEGTVEKIARIGYRNLEFAGYYNRTPEQVRALLDRLQVFSRSAHRRAADAPGRRGADPGGEDDRAGVHHPPVVQLRPRGAGRLAQGRGGVQPVGRHVPRRRAQARLPQPRQRVRPLEGTTGYDVP